MRVLIAFDKFKHCLSATRACELTATTLRTLQPDWSVDLCPLTDGGEGFCEILTRAGGGSLHAITVTGPRGDPVDACFGLVPFENIPPAARALLSLPACSATGMVALVEMAQASGLGLLPPERRDPWHATTRGTGELIRAAHAAGARTILLGVGGSATHDLGAGALAALGLRFLNAGEHPLANPTPARWPEIIRVDGHLPDDLPPIRIACDVANPLLGPGGAAAVYGPQKGLATSRIQELDNASARLAGLLIAQAGAPAGLAATPGSGAAGGIAFGFLCSARALLVPGSDLVSAWLDLDARLAAAGMVITGEGRFDESSLSGKGPGALVVRARNHGKPAHVFAGRIAVPPVDGCTLHGITPVSHTHDQALREATPNLIRALQTVFAQ
ncbi:MAG: glycerate kinase [Rariglobus sp.]|jgi:glycerate kinase|nr:glycerate kinase [Rariglobus sp.]